MGTGTDAIALALRALGIGAGDEVITSPLSAAYSALAIMMAGATPVFADLDPDRLTLDPARVEAAITPRTRALLPVHLYGQPADMAAMDAIARRHNLTIVEDACQAHLATSNGRPVGTIGAAGAFSFYPTKNLGAFGDAGAIVTNDAALAVRLKRLRNGGQTNRYHHLEFGVNTRLDEMQAAILRARLPRKDLQPEHPRRRRSKKPIVIFMGTRTREQPRKDAGLHHDVGVGISGEPDLNDVEAEERRSCERCRSAEEPRAEKIHAEHTEQSPPCDGGTGAAESIQSIPDGD